MCLSVLCVMLCRVVFTSHHSLHSLHLPQLTSLHSTHITSLNSHHSHHSPPPGLRLQSRHTHDARSPQHGLRTRHPRLQVPLSHPPHSQRTLREPRVPPRRPEALSHAGDSWDRLVRAVEERTISQLSTEVTPGVWCDGQHVGGPDGTCTQFSSAVDACVPNSGKGTDEESKQRDIPMPLVTSGVETGSLRQLALQRLADLV